MVDEKKLRGEAEHKITPGEIEAWKRGGMEVLRDRLHRSQINISPDRAVVLIKLYAQFGDVHALALRLDVTVNQVRQVLSSFGIQSIEDAKTLIREGIIAELDKAQEEQSVLDQAAYREERQDAVKRHEEEEARLKPEQKSPEELDQSLSERQQVAQIKNKRDQIRALVAEGIDPKTGQSDFKVALRDISEFKGLIPFGVSQIQRRFGGTKADIVREIKRLAPNIDTDMLRP